MLSNLSNNNSGNATKSVVEKKHYEDIEKRLDEMQDEIEMTEQGVSTNSQAIASLDERVGAVEDNSTFPELNTDTINPATGNGIDITGNLVVDGTITADFANFGELSVNGTDFTTVKDNAAQAKSIAENAKNKADEAYDLADALSDELADYKSDNEQSITTGTLNADSVITGSVAAQTINTNDFETTNAEIDKLYVDTIKATGFLELPTAGQSYYTITIPAKTTASFSGVYTSDNNTDYPFYFTVSDGAVIYKQDSTEIIRDISFDRETGYTKVRVKSSTNLTYISSALDNNPVTIEDGGDAYTDYVFIPQKTGGYLIRGYDDTTTEIYIAGVLRAYAMSVEEEIIERTSVDFLKINNSIELPKDWDVGGTISYSTGEENQYISAQTKAGVTKPTWTSPIHSTIGSLSYSSKLVDEATIASYKGISETRQTQTISITNEASLQQLTAFHWTKNGNYWQPYETTRITIGDNTMWIDPTEANQGIRFYDNQVIADGTWDDVPVEEANAVPVNLVIFDAPTELSFPITNLGDKTTVHGEITATCFKGNVLGNVTGNADTATNATCFDNKTYAEAKADILSGCAADSNKFNGKTYSEACADILSGNAATATNATCFDGHTYECAKADILSGCAACADNATCFDGCTYAQAKADILSGNAASATNATCFDGCTYSQAKADILSGNAASATNATCFDNKTYSQAKADILSGNAATATNATCFDGCTYAQAKADIRNYTPSYATCTSCPIIHATTDTVATQHKIPFAKYTGSANDETPLNCDDCFYYATVSQRLNTKNLCVSCCAEIDSAHILSLQTYNVIDGKACKACCSNCAQTVYTGGSTNTQKLLSSTCGWSSPNQTCIDYALDSNTLSNANIDISGCSLKAKTGCFTGNVEIGCNVNIGGDLNVAGTITTTHSEEVVTPSENIILRNGATTAIPSGHYSGFTVTNYDGHNNNLEVGANSDGTLHIGTTTGTMEPVATRACEACMENDYVAHWDSTGTDLVTKGASCTHNLCINGNASTTGNLSVAGNATVTGTLTADLTGTADNATCFDNKTYAQAKSDILSGNAASATNATCFNGKTYSQACADILSGNAASATNATCFNGCTYSQAKTDILSGNAASATNATCFNGCTYAQTKTDILSGCAADSAKLGNKDASCYIDNSNTAQTKAGNLSIGAPAACTSTSAGGQGIELSNAGGLELYHSGTPHIDFHYAKYCGDYSTRILNCDGSLNITINNGKGCTRSSEEKTYTFCSNGTFTGATNICGTNIYQSGNKVIDTSSTTQTKAGSLSIGAPASCTSTSAGGQGIELSNAGGLELYHSGTPYIDFHYQKYCGDFSSRITNLYATNSCNGIIRMTVNNGKGCTASDTTSNYDFYSSGTFTGASIITASTNIYSNGCPVVTTGTLPTVAPGYNCTGTSNYVVTTMVCCACTVRRNPTHVDSTCHVTLFGGNGAVDYAGLYVSDGCPLTYNPATGVLTTCRISSPNIQDWKFGQSILSSSAAECYYLLWERTANNVSYTGPIRIKGNFGYYGNTEKSFFDISVDFRNGIPSMQGTVSPNGPSAVRIIPTWDSSNCTARIYFRQSDVQSYSGIWFDISCASSVPSTYTGYTSMSGTPNDNWLNLIGTYVRTSSSNAEYPLVFSTCCATPSNRNLALYNDSTNSLMYNPSTNTLRTNIVRGNVTVRAGNPIVCTSTQSGSSGTEIIPGCVELLGSTPFINFRVDDSCEASHAIIGNNGYLSLMATNATGCTAATQTAEFYFCSDGTLKATRFDGAATCATSAVTVNRIATSNNATCHLALLSGCSTIADATIYTANACPLTFNPATGELATRSVAAKYVMLGDNSYISEGVNAGDTWMGEMLLSNYDGFTICAKHPTCSASSHNWAYAVACCTYTSFGVRAKAACNSVAVGYNTQATGSDSIAIGRDACTRADSVAVGCGATACCCAIAIGHEASANDGSIAIGYGVRAGCVGNVCTSTINIGSTVFNSSNAGIAIVSWKCDTKQCDLYNSLACTFCKQRVIACGVAKRIGHIPVIITKCCSGEITSNTPGGAIYSLYHCNISTNCSVFFINNDYTGDRQYTIYNGCTDVMPATTGLNSSTSVYIYY